ncbi:MAG TPA: cell division protein FtsQ/DivIB [Rhodopila sp.]|jgi:cell division protein FtsQ|nr:cell division protein FtsQ/DivIB [Rhodopila sp.]
MSRVRLSPRNSVNDRPSGWRLALRRQRRFLRPAICFASASLVTMVLVFLASAVSPAGSGRSLGGLRDKLSVLAAASGLRVTNVQIEGRANTPEPILRAAIGVNIGDPILGFSLEEVRSRVESIQWVEHATVERRLPGTLVINLQERRPFAKWQNQGKFVLVDRTGQVVADQDVAQFPQLPLIVGAGAPVAAAQLLDALQQRPSIKERVSASQRVGERRWNLWLTNGTEVMLPEGHEVAALDRLIRLQQDHALLDRPLAAIDMRLPDRLVFRAKTETKDGVAGPHMQGGSAAPTVPVIAKKTT